MESKENEAKMKKPSSVPPLLSSNDPPLRPSILVPSSLPIAIPRSVPVTSTVQRQFEVSPVSSDVSSNSFRKSDVLRMMSEEIPSSFKSAGFFGGSRPLVTDLMRTNSLSGVSTPASEARSEPIAVPPVAGGETKVPAGKKKSLKTQISRDGSLHRSTLSSLFSGGFMQLQHQTSRKSQTSVVSSGSSQRVNIVTEAQSVLPSFSSAFSIENIASTSPPKPWSPHARQDEANKISSSFGDHLEKADPLSILDDPEYTDTVQSTDSVRSWLTRSMSVPPKYEYHASQHKHLKGQEEVELQEQPTWRQTMEDLVEKPEYIDSIESTSSQAKLLGRTALAIGRESQKPYDPDLLPCDEEEPESSIDISFGVDPKEHLKYAKNLAVLSTSFTLIFIAYMSLRNLQSSLNDAGGLGLIALSSVYASLFFGCIFATSVVQRLRPKLTMLVCGAGFLVYTVANLYPHFFVLIPASCIAGFSLANMWTAHATYLTNIAARYAELRSQVLQHTLSKFNGIFYMFFQTSQIWGGIIASNVLVNRHTDHLNSTLSNGTNILNKTICGAEYCHVEATNVTKVPVEPEQVYLLVGIYAASVVLGIAVIWIFLDPLDGTMRKSQATVPDQLLAVFKFFGSRKVVCLVGIMFYSLLQNSFMFGEFTKAFVTCPVGVHMVGYCMLCLSAFSAVASYTNGKLQQYIGRIPLFAIGGVIHMTLLNVMLLWTPDSGSVAIFFTIAGLWGIGDGIFVTQTVSLFGVLFGSRRESAFAGLKMCQATGATLLFVTSPYSCTKAKIYMMIGVLLVAMAGYASMETMLWRRNQSHTKKKLGPTSV